MDDEMQSNEQAKLWNGPAGQAWVEMQPLLDQVLQPFADVLVHAVSASPCERVLDVGCGAGGTTLAIARTRWTPKCLGIDISEHLAAAARTRAARESTAAAFVCADAQTHAFAPGSFDTVVSRFGVMFFSDPVEAFRNLRRATVEDGRLHFVAWRSAEENPFMITAERIATPLLPKLTDRPANGPGQFAFADPLHIDAVLKQSGWADIDVQPIDAACSMPEKQLIPYLSRLGRIGVALQEVDETTRKRVLDTVRAGFEPFVAGDEVRFTGACWVVHARAGASETH